MCAFTRFRLLRDLVEKKHGQTVVCMIFFRPSDAQLAIPVRWYRYALAIHLMAESKDEMLTISDYYYLWQDFLLVYNLQAKDWVWDETEFSIIKQHLGNKSMFSRRRGTAFSLCVETLNKYLPAEPSIYDEAKSTN